MTDRDTFAAAALTGLLSNDYFSLGEDAAKRCYEYADAMLRERDKTSADSGSVTPESYAQGDEKRGVRNTDRITLTAEEREAVEWAATFVDENYAMGAGATLRKLLERLA